MSPSREQINNWKKEYGNIFSITISSTDFIFREITFAEFDDVYKHQIEFDSAEAEDYLVSIALLYPPLEKQDYDKMPAGVVSSIAEEILEMSAMGYPKRAKALLEKHREDNAQVRNLMKAFVLATMPAYKEEELDQLTFDKLAKKVALSEQIIQINQKAFGVENEITLDLIDPEEEELQAEKEAYQKTTQNKPGQAGAKDPIAQRLAEAVGG